MSTNRIFEPFADHAEEIVLDAATVGRYGLAEWALQFALGTAGYRDLENPDDLFDLGVPFNPLTMAVITEAESTLYRAGDTLHLGGESRAWTAEFIDLTARILAAKGIVCRLGGETDPDGPIPTTPIWLSSFGVFYEELAGGENFTSSHSQYFKGGRKPMDRNGMQLLDQAAVIERGVREIIARAGAGERVVIPLAASNSPLIRRDFRVMDAYARSLGSLLAPDGIAAIRTAGAEGFRLTVCPEGGSMGRNSRKLFEMLGIPTGEGGVVRYTHFEQDSRYHGIGIVDGVNHGVDPGKWQVYKNVGAREVLLSGASHVFFIWDPDGDRFNMVTTAPAALEGRARMNGLETDPGDGKRILVYFKPNQIYFMLLAWRLERGAAQEGAEGRPWLVMETYPTSRSIGELAERLNIPVFRTPVGFKHFGNACAELETQELSGAAELALTDVRGRVHRFPRGTRVLIMAEESGGAAMGGEEMLVSRSGSRRMLALKEKDGFQVGLTALALAADLFREEKSFAEYYLERLDRHDILHRFYERRDVTLFDEALKGDARRQAMEEGNRRKDATVGYFRGLADRLAAGSLTAGEVTAELQSRHDGSFVFPPVTDVYWAGDGTLIEFEGAWFQLRASGTDAVLRYYAEAASREEVRRLNDALFELQV